MSETVSPQTVEDFLAIARERLPRAMWDRLLGDYGAESWRTTTNNVTGFNALALRPRVLVDVSQRSLATQVLGTEIALPVMIAPSGAHQRWHASGELATAKAACRAGTVMALSTAATYSVNEVAAVTDGPLWFQLYIFRDRRLSRMLIERAEQAGCRAIVLTVDMPGTRSRERDVSFPRYDLGREFDYAKTIDPGRLLRNLQGLGLPAADLPTQRNLNSYFDDALTWADLAWLRESTTLPIVIKGIQTGDDARLCRECGVDGIVASNHGGFAIPNARATIETLPEIVAQAGELEVYLDGGVRRGTDVLKALALGARAVLIGRAQIFGLVAGGEEGVVSVLEILRDELDQALRYCGLTDVREADEGLLSERMTPGPGELAERLCELARMLEVGLLSRAEFEAGKRDCLGVAAT
jgi:4-hydroxymandelate oxidase